MADNTINVRIKDRSDTEANWTSKNPVLLKGERAITDGTGKYKIGDGKNTWSALPYYEAMTSADRTKLNGIASGANKTTVDSSLSSSSTNPVQNKVVNSALAGKSNTSHTHDLSTMINTLSIGSSTPTDDDYFVSQYVGGGTTTTTYYRRPVKALLEYIKGKFAKVATSGSYNDLSNKPTIPSVGNGTITIKQAGAVKGSFTTNQSGATTIELTDNNTNTWRDVIDNLTSTATDKSLSAKQGKLLNDNKAEIREWSAQIKCATWSRLCYVEQKGSVIGSSFILNISGTRTAVVYNDTFVIKVHHSQKATISKISGSTYSTGIQVRVVSDSSGNCYVEMYENVNGATNTTTQIVYCSLIDIACGAITTYTSFTNGASIPTGFTSNATITTNSNSLQGNLTWGEITGKPAFKTIATSGSYNDLSNKPTIGNGTVTITQGGTSRGTFTLNQTGNTTIALTDNNTWRGIQNNLTSTSTDQSLSAVQGKWLNENKAAMTTLKGSENLNDITTPGMYSCGGENSITNKPSNVDAFGLIVTHNANGSFYTQILHSNGGVSYRRNCNNGTWASWTEEKHTDTVYTHPSYTAKSNGLYKVTVDSKGHVSGTTAVSKADITALGIPSTNTTYSTGTASTSGLTKLYTETGTATDGTMTQSAIKSALDGKSNNGHTHDDRYYTESEINSKLSGKANSSHTHSQYYDSSISRTANTVLAAPNGSNGTASFRKLVASDLPSHTHNYAGSSSAGGAAWSSNAVNNIFGGSRQTSGNIDFTNSAYVNKVTYTLATSAMTTGKPPEDGHILNFGWDTDAGWGAQMSLGSESNNHLYIRGADSKDNKTTYGDWKTILDSSNYNIYTPTKTGGGASGTWGISITGNAATATKLGTSAGSGTQPVYFSGGKPVAGTYTLGNACSKTTRTLTNVGNSGWKDASTDSNYVPDMSFIAYWNGAYSNTNSNLAYCNKGAFGTAATKNTDYFATAGHTHNYVKDAGNNSSNTTFAYSKAGMNYGDYTWLAGWNGYELRAVAKSQFATAGHTHNYAGSSSAGGSANSAVKLATARSVSNTEDFVMSFSYDGSANSNASLRYYNSRISVGNTNNYPYHRFAKIDKQTSSYIDKTSTFLITQDYNDGGWGIVRISLRTNNSSSVSTVEAKWLVRCGLNVDCVQIGLYNVFGKTYADAFFKTSGTYTGTVIRNLASGARGNIFRTWILTDSAEANSTTTSDKKTSTESYASTSAAATTLHSQAYTSVVVASDGGTVSYANSAGNASKVNNHTVNSNVPSGAKFTDTVYSHPTTSGNKHIPSGGSSGQILRWSSDGTAVWGNDNNTTYTLSSITGTLAVSKGGTGSTTAAGGRSNLGAVGFVCQSAEPSGQNNGDLWFKEE